MYILLNLAIAGIVALNSWLMLKWGISGFIGLFALVFIASLPARVYEARITAVALRGGSNRYGRILVIPLYMCAIVIDLYAVATVFRTLFPGHGQMPHTAVVMMLAAMAASVFFIIREARITYRCNSFSARMNGAQANPLTGLIIMLYAGLFGSILWVHILPGLEEKYAASASEGMFTGLLYYMVFMLPFERGWILRRIDSRYGWLLILLGLILAYACVAWTIMP
jgi:hypothetical protein